MIYPDVIPMWFGIPAAIALIALWAVLARHDHVTRMRAIRAEARRIDDCA